MLTSSLPFLAVLKVGTNIAKMIPSQKYVKDINVELLIEAIDNELDGQIVDVSFKL
ncbi:hypothetical protein [Neobacillus cucumis]|uniref:hypothetical protein n=1 Tax=Neobacillus cucumis TaxID=1740721 RepID=UPI0019635369|nr:hypothetical protein [Neobacillus cucumis]MBM7651169.1 hypothetical protein [Neobacillus cucumis]